MFYLPEDDPISCKEMILHDMGAVILLVAFMSLCIGLPLHHFLSAKMAREQLQCTVKTQKYEQDSHARPAQ